MKLPMYEDHEREFLEAMATRFYLSGKNRIIFVERFREKNAELNDIALADEWERELLRGTKKGDAYRIFRQQLRVICKKLAQEGCDFGDSKKGKWKIAKRWLREVLYPEWIKHHQSIALYQIAAKGITSSAIPTSLPASKTFKHNLVLACDRLWQQLWEKAIPTDKMRPVLLNPQPVLTLGIKETKLVETKPLSFPLGSKIRFEVNLDGAGHLLLLEKGTSGKMWCLCPSSFAPEQHPCAGWVTLPQVSSRHKYFKLTGLPGQEEIVGVITKEVPRLDWLPKPGEPLLQLQERHLSGLLEYLNHCRDYQVLRIAYKVTEL